MCPYKMWFSKWIPSKFGYDPKVRYRNRDKHSLCILGYHWWAIGGCPDWGIWVCWWDRSFGSGASCEEFGCGSGEMHHIGLRRNKGSEEPTVYPGENLIVLQAAEEIDHSTQVKFCQGSFSKGQLEAQVEQKQSSHCLLRASSLEWT